MSGNMPWFVAPDRKDLVFVPGVAQPMRCGSAERARLIAAAPKLIKALKLAVLQNSHDMLMTGDELRICESAIAEATGETP